MRISSLFFLLTITIGAFGQSSVLSSGQWFKVSITKDGIYKISADQFRGMGFDLSKTDPRNIKIYGHPGGMLPQPNASPRPYDLQEIPIWVEGESDGKFDGRDFILFYGEGPDKIEYNFATQNYNAQKNLYSTLSYYFVTVNDGAGKRISSRDNQPGDHPVITESDDFIYHEEEKVKLKGIISGREWFGETFSSTNSIEFKLNLSGVTDTRPLRFTSNVLGQSFDSTFFKIFFNNTLVYTHKLGPIPSLQYGQKAVLSYKNYSLEPAEYSISNSNTLKYEFKRALGSSEGYLDCFLVTFSRALSLYGNQWTFVNSHASAPVSQFQISGVSTDGFIWEVTDTYNIVNQKFSIANNTASFSVATDSPRKFIVANSNFEIPTFAGSVANQNLHDLTTPNLLVITHPDFINEAERFASHRSVFNGISVQVVTVDKIYNEFSSGRQDVTALRDFVRHLFLKSPGTLKSLLLFGKSSYDYKNILNKNANFVPTYQSRNSIHPLHTYSSDDYFSFLEENEGSWLEDPIVENHTLDIGVGRLPVTNTAEASTVVDKIIQYDTDEKLKGIWRKRIVFVGDDGNGEDFFSTMHQEQADEISETVEFLNPAIDTKKLFMGSYQKTVRPNGETVNKMTEDILRNFDLGTLIMNYTGHGSPEQWADEDVFNIEHIKQLRNEKYPFMVTATCEFGRHDNPLEISAAEALILQPKGGAIGLVTTARPVSSFTNKVLNEAFYQALLNRDGVNYKNFGEVFRVTKNSSTSGLSNRNFSLLADPSQVLALPTFSVAISEVKTLSGSDTLKALSESIVKGQVLDEQQNLMTSFNGVVEITVFDKQNTYVTGGRNLPYEYKQWNNALFRGNASVKNGQFELNFTLPKNIAYQIAPGRISAYAKDTVSNEEAIGSYNQFKVGGTEKNPINDSQSPRLRAFIGDTTFVNGGMASPDSWLWVTIHDNTGINISNYGIGNSLTATLDNDSETFFLNDYFVSYLDKSSSGYIRYPLRNLKPGRHTIHVKAWDTHNNSGETQVDFVVIEGEQLRIETVGNFPNPFRDQTTLFFTHNKAGDDLQAHVSIMNMAGQVLLSKEVEILSSAYRVDLGEIDLSEHNGKKLLPGLYLARIIIRSLTNGSKNERVAKLILLN